MCTPTGDYAARILQKPEPSIELEAGLHIWMLQQLWRALVVAS